MPKHKCFACLFQFPCLDMLLLNHVSLHIEKKDKLQESMVTFSFWSHQDWCLTLTFLKAPQNWKFELACVEGRGGYLSLGKLLADPRRCWAARQTGGEFKVLKVDSKVVSKVDSKANMEVNVKKVIWTQRLQEGLALASEMQNAACMASTLVLFSPLLC